MPSNHLILCSPLLLPPSIFPRISVFSNESVRIRWSKYWSFNFNISTSNEYSGLISLLLDSVHSLSCVRLCATPWTAARQASLSITNFRSLLKLKSIELVMPTNHVILSSPYLPAFYFSQHQGSFLMSWLFASGSQSIGASASALVLPVNIQD